MSSTTPFDGAVDVPLNVSAVATFTEALDPATVNEDTFTVTLGTVEVPGTIDLSGLTVRFTPDDDLAPGRTFLATLHDGITDVAGNALEADYTWSFTSGAALDVTAPQVIGTLPALGALDVPSNTAVLAWFDEGIDPLSVGPSSFVVRDGTQVVDGELVTNGSTVIFAADDAFDPGTVYTVTVTPDVTDLAGNALAAEYAWTFTVGAPDLVPPLVVLTQPGDNATDVAVNTPVVAVFSEAMDPTSLTTDTFELTGPGGALIVGTVVVDGSSLAATFTPQNDLVEGLLYTGTLGTGATDVAGNGLASDYVWTFRAAGEPDVTPPTVTLTNPGDSATGVAIGTSIHAAFSEPMAPASLNDATVFVTRSGGVAVDGQVSYDVATQIVTFEPDAALLLDEVYSVTLTPGATDLAGNGLLLPYGWSFQTAPDPDLVLPTVTLTNPANGAVDVVAVAIYAAFSEPMDPATLNAGTFEISRVGGADLTGAVVYDPITQTASFTPTSALALDTQYRATVRTGAQDLAGNGLALDHVWTFRTAADPDAVAPTVILTTPRDGAVDVSPGVVVYAAFSEPMNPATLTVASVQLSVGGAPVPGTVVYDVVDQVVSFRPTATLGLDAVVTATITDSARDLAGNVMVDDYVWTFRTSETDDAIAPSVTLVTPRPGAIDVPVTANVAAAFSEPMAPGTVNGTTFQLTRPNGTVVPGAVVYDVIDQVATFRPTNDLALNTLYTATVTDGVQDLAGNALADDYVWTFRTAADPDAIDPFVTLTNPADGALGVPVSITVNAAFSEAMNPATVNGVTFTLTPPTGPAIAGVVLYDAVEQSASFNPNANLLVNTEYTASLTTGAQDLAGNPLEPYVWSFTTDVAADTTAPTVTLTTPVSGANQVATNLVVRAAFSEPMNAASLNATSVTVTGPSGVPRPGVVVYSALTQSVSFDPSTDLALDTLYTATIAGSARDLAGNTMGAPYVWTFRTAADPDGTAPTVILTNPVDGASDVVAVAVYAAFSEPMNPATLNTTTFLLTPAGNPALTGVVVYDPLTQTASFTPNQALALDTLYSGTIRAAASDLAGNGLAQDYVWTFRTAPDPDAVPPTVILTTPRDGVADVPPGATLYAAFSEPMNPATLNVSTFLLTSGGVPVNGAVVYDVVGQVASFRPNQPLALDTLYTATVTDSVRDLLGNTMLVDYVWTFRTADTADAIAPVVTLVTPQAGDTDVPITTTVSAAFSEPMAPATLHGVTFQLTRPNGTVVPGSVVYDVIDQVATFNPTADLALNTLYTATVTDGVEDLAGNAMLVDYVWTFRTAPDPDAIPPFVTLTNPEDGALGVPVTVTVNAAFSEAMNPATVNGTTFRLTPPTGPAIAGVVLYDVVNQTATFRPNADLLVNTEYTATLTNGARDLAGNTLVPYVWSFITDVAADTTPPTVTFTLPADDATNVPTNTDIEADFSEAMAPATVTGTTFRVSAPGNLPVLGAVTYDVLTQTATFAPTATLLPNTEYTARITVAATDLAGNALVSAYVWTFTTALAPDTTAPLVVSTDPEDDALDVLVGTSVEAEFSEAMNPLSLTGTTFRLTGPGNTPVTGSVSYDVLTQTATFNPNFDLLAGTLYTGRLTPGVADLAGNGLANAYVWTFTTADGPEVFVTVPQDGAELVFLDTTVEATFTQDMDPNTLDEDSFLLEDELGNLVSGIVVYDDLTATAVFQPDLPLLEDTLYTATITVDAENENGIPLQEDFVWTFATGLAALQPIDLGSLEPFVAVAGAGLTNSNSAGVTVLGGDVGLSPTGTCVGDGAPCTITNPVIQGTLFANDPEGIAAQAKADLLIAMQEAQGRPPGTPSSDLSGLVLAPGVYTSGSTMMVAVGGTVTLDGQGNQNAVWIFQIGSSLTVNDSAQVLLINGAQARNVFWVAGASSTIAGNVSFKGTVMAGASNSVGTGSVVEGRLLCANGSITLLANTITLPL